MFLHSFYLKWAERPFCCNISILLFLPLSLACLSELGFLCVGISVGGSADKLLGEITLCYSCECLCTLVYLLCACE